jgi:hypothetical protein
MATKISDSEMGSDLKRHMARADNTGQQWPHSPLLGRASLAKADAESPAAALVEALVEALDGSERKLLLSHLARTYPDVVETSAAWLAEFHEAARERQRTARRRREHDKRRRHHPKSVTAADRVSEMRSDT